MTKTNELRTQTTTFWFLTLNGKPVARLAKKASGFRRFSVLKLSTDEWKQFNTEGEALAFAAA